MRKAIFLVSLLAILAGKATPQLRPIELKDYYGLEWVSAPALSPDGHWVAYVRTRIIESANKRHSEVWLASAGEMADPARPPVQISDAGVNATNPRWSADGKLLAFSSGDAGAGVAGQASPSQMLVPMNDGKAGASFQIKGLEGSPVFSPDGKWIAFTKKVPQPDAPTQTSEFDKLTDERFKGLMYDWMNFRYDRRGYLPDPRNGSTTPPQELFILPSGGGEARQLTHGGIDVMDPTWRADSKALAFTADLHQRDEYAYERADLWTVGLEGDLRRITNDDGWHHLAPAWSPDGEYIAVLREEGLARILAAKKTQGSAIDLFLFPAGGGAGHNITANWDGMPERPRWSPDGTSIYFQAGLKGTEHLYRIGIAHGNAIGKVEQVTMGDRVVADVTMAGSRMAYVSSNTASPVELYTASLPPPNSSQAPVERRVSAANVSLSSQWEFGKVERIHFDSKDGTSIDGWVALPPGYDTTKKTYPLILMIHGGPHGDYKSSFDFEEQAVAAAGALVVYTNPRGSTGYGEKFRWGTWGGWGERDFEDVMAGIDFAIAHYRVDPKRLGVTGYSYGGFLTNWIIGHTTRFAAAVVGAGPSDWISNYGTGDIPRTKESEFFGRPWEEKARATMLAHSPVLFADRVQTPALFIHGEADMRVPIAQGEEMYTALKKRRVPAKFVRYPGEYHGGWSPWDTVHSYREQLRWWQTYLHLGD